MKGASQKKTKINKEKFEKWLKNKIIPHLSFVPAILQQWIYTFHQAG